MSSVNFYEMHQLNQFNNVKEISEFSKNEKLEFSIDSQVFLQINENKNYYQLTSLLNKYISDYNLIFGNDALYALKNFLRFITTYVKTYKFLSFEENKYLLDLADFIKKLHLRINNKIDKHPIDHAVDIIQEKILLGNTIDDLEKFIDVNDFPIRRRKDGFLELFSLYFKVKILICENDDSFEINDANNSFVVIASSKNINLDKFKKVTNIIRLYIRVEDGFIYLPMSNSVRSAARLFFLAYREIKGNNQDFSQSAINEVENLHDDFQRLIDDDFGWRINGDLFDVLKKLRIRVERIKNYISFFEINSRKNVDVILSSLINYLKIAFITLKFRADLDHKIDICLSEIKRSSSLYIKSGSGGGNSDVIFSEDNFSSIIASNLRCLFYSDKSAQINCEALVGKGRSDIEVKVNKRTLAFIESKMIKRGEDTSKKVGEGLDQLFSRYSENYSVNADPCIRLYLLLFSYDKNFNNLADKIYSEIESYAKRNSLVYDKINATENKLTFLYKEERIEFMDKYRILEIEVCNLEVDYKKKSIDRRKKSDYVVGKKN